jgi:hypothetical protein
MEPHCSLVKRPQVSSSPGQCDPQSRVQWREQQSLVEVRMFQKEIEMCMPQNVSVILPSLGLHQSASLG